LLSSRYRFLRRPRRPNPAIPVTKSARAPGIGPACANGNANAIRPAPMVNERTAPTAATKNIFTSCSLLIRSPPSRFLPRVEKQKIALFY